MRVPLFPLLSAIAISMSVVCSACSSSSSSGTQTQTSSTATYVGTVDGTDVNVGLATDGTHVALFFCGGPTSYATSTKWIRSAIPSAAQFSVSAGTWSATAMTSDATASGTVNRGDGNVLNWTATRVPDGSILGLYESIGADGTAGVVVRSTDQGGVQGAFVPIDAKAIEQIIPIFPLERTPEGLAVTVENVQQFVPPAPAE